MNSQDGDSSFRTGRRELDLPVDSSRSEEGGVEDIYSRAKWTRGREGRVSSRSNDRESSRRGGLREKGGERTYSVGGHNDLRRDTAGKREAVSARARTGREGWRKGRKEISSSTYLDVLRWLEPIQLVQQLQHRPLHLRVTPSTLVPRATDTVDLIHEDDTRSVLPRHHEQLPDHPASLSDVLLHQFRPTDSNESTVRVMSDSPSEQGLSRSRRSVEEDSLGLSDSEGVEEFWVFDGQFDDLLDLLDLLVESSDHLVGGVRYLLDHHERDERIDLVGEDLVEFVRVGTESDAEVGSEEVDVDVWVKVDDWVGER